MQRLLEVNGLCTEFVTPGGRVRAVDGVSFHLDKGETLGLVGESGCGKSVTSLSIMRLLQKGVGEVVEGEVLFEGKDLMKLSERELRSIRGNRMSMIFQEPMGALNPVYKIGSQMSEVLILHKGMKKKEAWEKSIELLKSVGISRPEMVVNDYPHQLSGGMLQRVMIAMAMSCQPQFLIADEPTTALDVTIQAQILELMNDLKEHNDTAILMITHNLGVVAEVCDRVIVMYAGQMVESADVNTLFASPTHPYTRGLLQCIPKLEETRSRLDIIDGIVPSPFNMPEGCRFSPRCAYATERCKKEKPEAVDLGGGHTCRCFLCQNGGEA